MPEIRCPNKRDTAAQTSSNQNRRVCIRYHSLNVVNSIENACNAVVTTRLALNQLVLPSTVAVNSPLKVVTGGATITMAGRSER